MKVLHVTPSFYPAMTYGGPIESTYQLCRHLASAGCDLRVVTTDANGRHATLNVKTNIDLELEPRLHVRYCGRKWRHSFSPNLFRCLADYIHWAEVVHLTAVFSSPTIPTLLACKILGKPVVWSPRGALQRWEGSTRVHIKALWERVCWIVAPQRLVLHVTSDEEATESLHRFPGLKVVVIPNGVGVPDVVSPAHDKDRLKLLFLGRLHPIKGIENLLDACSLLSRRASIKWSLTIAGSGEPSYTRSLQSRIDTLGISNQVSMIGEVSGKVKLSLFDSSAVTVVPSFTENFGMVVAESLAHRIPVIAGRGTPWKHLEEMGCGLWVDNTPESLAKAIEQMSRMPLGKMGQRGRKWMQAEFAWPSVAEQMAKLYHNLMIHP